MTVNTRFLIGYSLLILSYSIYYTVSRPLFGIDLYERGFIFFIAGAEYLPAIFSFLFGSMSDYFGRKKILYLTFIGLFPLAYIFLATKREAIIVFISTYSFFHTLALTISISMILENRASVGRNYSLLGLASGFGWALGSSLAWIAYLSLGKHFFAFLLSITYLAGVCGIISGYRGKDKEGGSKILLGLRSVYRDVGWFFPILLLAYIGTIIGSNMNAILLDYKLKEFIQSEFSGAIDNTRILYGLFYAGLPVMVAIPARIIAGKLADKGKDKTLFTLSIISYILIYVTLPFMPPLLFLLVWLIPVYPFYDTSIYSISSRETTSHEASISGFLSSITSLAGFLVILINLLIKNVNITVYVFLVLITLTISLLLFTCKARAKRSEMNG